MRGSCYLTKLSHWPYWYPCLCWAHSLSAQPGPEELELRLDTPGQAGDTHALHSLTIVTDAERIYSVGCVATLSHWAGLATGPRLHPRMTWSRLTRARGTCGPWPGPRRRASDWRWTGSRSAEIQGQDEYHLWRSKPSLDTLIEWFIKEVFSKDTFCLSDEQELKWDVDESSWRFDPKLWKTFLYSSFLFYPNFYNKESLISKLLKI